MLSEYDSVLNNLQSDMKGVVGQAAEAIPTLDEPSTGVVGSGRAWELAKRYGPYVAIPIIVATILASWRPAFVKVEKSTELGEVKVFSFKKFAIWSVVIALPIMIGIYVYFHKAQ